MAVICKEASTLSSLIFIQKIHALCVAILQDTLHSLNSVIFDHYAYKYWWISKGRAQDSKFI